MSWLDQLHAEERAHAEEQLDPLTLDEFVEVRKFQRRAQARAALRGVGYYTPCFECEQIERRLMGAGLIPTGDAQ